MSIIYLKDSITDKRDVFENSKKSFNSKILATDSENKNAIISDDFSLDLTLGNSWNENYSYNDRRLYKIEEESISIKPKSSVVVSVNEIITVPNNLFGLVISTGSIFLQHGVQSPSAKVEPGYEGALILRLVNFSNKSVTINKGTKIASVIFFRTEHTPSFTHASNSNVVNIKKKSFGEISKAYAKNFFSNHAYKLIPIIISSLALIVAAGNYFKTKDVEYYKKSIATQKESPKDANN